MHKVGIDCEVLYQEVPTMEHFRLGGQIRFTAKCWLMADDTVALLIP